MASGWYSIGLKLPRFRVSMIRVASRVIIKVTTRVVLGRSGVA